jgi:hypothetical protein
MDIIAWGNFIFRSTALIYLIALAIFLAGPKKPWYDYGLRALNIWYFLIAFVGVIIKVFALTNAWIQLGRMPKYKDALESGIKFRHIVNHQVDEVLSIVTSAYSILFIIPMLLINSYWYYKKRTDLAAKWTLFGLIGVIVFYLILLLTGMMGYISMLYD